MRTVGCQQFVSSDIADMLTSFIFFCDNLPVRIDKTYQLSVLFHLAAESLRIIPICIGLAAGRVLLMFYRLVSQPSSVIAVDFPAVSSLRLNSNLYIYLMYAAFFRKDVRSGPHTLPDYYGSMHTDSVRPHNTYLH